MSMRAIIAWMATGLLTLSAWAAPKAHTTADLVLPVEVARPGDTVWVGVRLRMEPHWHTYWQNSGDSGGPTEIAWSLPSGISAGDIHWPAPERLDVAGLTTFILQDEATLLVPLTLAKDLKPGPVTLSAQVSWLECSDICMPGEATVTNTLTIGDRTKPSANAAVLEAATAQLPQDGTSLQLATRWEAPATNHTRGLVFTWPASAGVSHPDFFPYPTEVGEVQLTPEILPAADGRLGMRVAVKASNSGQWPDAVRGVLVQTVDGRRQAYDVTLKPTDGTTASTSVASPGADSPAGSGGILKFLALAFLGGLVLNLMPCVLPILSLKILHIVQQRGAGESHAKKHSLFYLLGVVISFWMLAGLVLAGQLASWGAQFQDPRFVILMAALMTLVGLNLFGVFEIVLPGQTINKASELSTREGSTGAFFTGALSVVLGSSCAAPFLTVAIGWAFFQPPAVVLATFTAIGIGLAFPFVALSFLPALQKFLPRPGAWMERFKQAMGFPMLATAVWLLSQTADHYGDSGPLWVGFFLLVLALAAWIFGTFVQRGRKRRVLAAIVLVVIMVLGVDGTLERGLDWRHPPAVIPGNSSSPAVNGKSGINWQPWSHEAVARARAAGHPVLVDFTANWCPNCLVNKKTSLEIDSVREKIKTTGTVALIADYTRKNPDITAELRRFERSAVPLVLVYPKDADKPPQVLPALLTPGIVLDALTSAAQ